MPPFGSLCACVVKLVLVVRSQRIRRERLVLAACERVLLAKLACFALAMACSAKQPPEGSALARSGSGAAQQNINLELNAERAWPAPYASDTLWQRAQQGDALDRHALGQREGAEGLMRALLMGGSLGRTALAALRFAPDRASVSAELCELALRAEAQSRYPLLHGLHELLMEPPVSEEQIELGAHARCKAGLGSLRSRAALSSAEQDLVASIISRLEPTTPSGFVAR